MCDRVYGRVEEKCLGKITLKIIFFAQISTKIVFKFFSQNFIFALGNYFEMNHPGAKVATAADHDAFAFADFDDDPISANKDLGEKDFAGADAVGEENEEKLARKTRSRSRDRRRSPPKGGGRRPPPPPDVVK